VSDQKDKEPTDGTADDETPDTPVGVPTDEKPPAEPDPLGGI
jgi:hypothetical protein